MSGLSPKQLELRRSGVGGSEVAAVLGLSPYATPLDVWRSKVEGYAREETQAMRRGRLLEPAVVAMYAEETGAYQLAEVGTLRSKTRPLMLATPDRIAMLPDEQPCLLEAKTAGAWARGEWGEPGTDQVPESYLLQVLWTLGVTELPRADVAVLIAGDDFRVYRVERDEEMEAELYARVEAWWRAYVETRTPPPVDARESTGDWLAQRYQRHGPALLPATPHVEALAHRYARALAERQAWEEEERHAKHQLQALIGEDAGFEGPGLRVTWKRDRRGARRFRVVVDDEQTGEGNGERAAEAG